MLLLLFTNYISWNLVYGDHVGISLGLFWDHCLIVFYIVFGSCWDMCLSILCICWDQFLIIMKYVWNTFGIMFGQTWDRFGIIILFYKTLNCFVFAISGLGESFLDHSEIILGSFWNNYQTNYFVVRRRANHILFRAPGPGPSRPRMEYPVRGNPSLRPVLTDEEEGASRQVGVRGTNCNRTEV